MVVTRAHALAMMDPRHDLLVSDGGRELTIASSSTFLARGFGRIVLTRGDLLDHGVTLAGGGRRFSVGTGPTVDRILDSINDDIRRT